MPDNPAMRAAGRTGVRLLIGLLTVLAASPVSAATCNVSPQSVNFGSYDPISPLPSDGVGSVSVSCDLSVPYTISLDALSSSEHDRRLSAGASEMSYNLYADPERHLIWGDSTTGTGVSASGTNVNLPIYGRIPPRQNVPAGTYVDTIMVTVSY
jgi:spore coat protein U-like protein